jgi:hypothetical protein
LPPLTRTAEAGIRSTVERMVEEVLSERGVSRPTTKRPARPEKETTR